MLQRLVWKSWKHYFFNIILSVPIRNAWLLIWFRIQLSCDRRSWNYAKTNIGIRIYRLIYSLRLRLGKYSPKISNTSIRRSGYISILVFINFFAFIIFHMLNIAILFFVRVAQSCLSNTMNLFPILLVLSFSLAKVYGGKTSRYFSPFNKYVNVGNHSIYT